jgi:hypothetical protein
MPLNQTKQYGRGPKTYALGCVKIVTRPRYFALIQLSLSLSLSLSLAPPLPPLSLARSLALLSLSRAVHGIARGSHTAESSNEAAAAASLLISLPHILKR